MENIGKLRNMTSIYLLQGGKMLLLYRQGSRVVNQVWVGSAGGHFEKNELNDAMACVLRELREELSVTPDMLSGLKLRYVTLRRTDTEIRQNYYFFAALKDGCRRDLVSNEGVCRWFALDEVHKLKMPFTAQYVVAHYLQTGRYDDAVYGGIADGEKVVFTKMPAF